MSNEAKVKDFISIEQLFENNKTWAEKHVARNPVYFKELATQQKPQILWIGCADSRVPSNQIIKLKPGQVFTHRNIANVVTHTDLNCLSVLSYAVEVLKVRHIIGKAHETFLVTFIVCGHYGCGGVIAAEGNKQYGLIDNWLRNIKDIYNNNRESLEQLPPGKERTDLLVELNVARSVANVCHTTIVQNAWAKGHKLDVHGWVYRLEDGLIRPLGLSISKPEQVDDIYVTEEALNAAIVNSVSQRRALYDSSADIEGLADDTERANLGVK